MSKQTQNARGVGNSISFAGLTCAFWLLQPGTALAHGIGTSEIAFAFECLSFFGTVLYILAGNRSLKDRFWIVAAYLLFVPVLWVTIQVCLEYVANAAPSELMISSLGVAILLGGAMSWRLMQVEKPSRLVVSSMIILLIALLAWVAILGAIALLGFKPPRQASFTLLPAIAIGYLIYLTLIRMKDRTENGAIPDS